MGPSPRTVGYITEQGELVCMACASDNDEKTGYPILADRECSPAGEQCNVCQGNILAPWEGTRADGE